MGAMTGTGNMDAMDDGDDRHPLQSVRPARLFSTPFEVGLRAAVMLDAASPSRCDIRRLVIYDYLLVHSGDVEDGPTSLHPATPHRSGELLVKRDLMREALTLFVGRELIVIHFDNDGVTFSASDLTASFLGYLEAPYAGKLRSTARWVAQRFGAVAHRDLEQYLAAHLDRWGGEFHAESLVREVAL